MPRLTVVTPETASGEVKQLYGQIEDKFGLVLNIFQGMGNSSAALKAYLTMAETLAAGQLSPQDREVVYLTVSQKNECQYCVSAHTLVASGVGLDDEQIVAIRQFSPQSDKHRALADFVLRVMETRGFIQDADVEAVQQAGYTDGQIAESIGYIALATYSNFFNHVFDTELDFPSAPDVP